MKIFTTTELEQLQYQYFSESLANIKAASTQAKVSVFLSHSHKDKAQVKGLIRYFAILGIAIYVDWNDSSMPRVTNRETARQLKVRIRACDLFMVLATPNASESKWVPWEVGVADQIKGEDQVTIIPVADPSGQFRGAEYMQLYRKLGRLDYGTQSPWIYKQASENLDISADSYFRSHVHQ